MTPFAMRLVRAYASQPGGATMALRMCGATCFDITDVLLLASDAAAELAKTRDIRSSGAHVDHGELLFLPDEFVWIEWRYGGQRSGVFLNAVEDQIGFSFVPPSGEDPLVGFFELHEDGTFAIHTDTTKNKMETLTAKEKHSGEIGCLVAGALMLINAPRGVRRETQEPHKGLLRELKRHGKPELRPYHVIKLDTKAGNVGGGLGGGSPKGFHFCRAHLRRLPNGSNTTVRAHWRGDPALGICRATYEVAA